MSGIISKVTSALSGDVLFLVALFVIIFLCAMYFGKNRMASLVLAFYPATLLYKSFPFINKLTVLSGDTGILINKIVIFLVFFVLISIVIRKYLASYDESSGVFSKIGLTLAILIIILVFSYNIVSFDTFHNFSAQIDTLFKNNNLIFWWNLTPLVILAFI
jgi:hypothetical protein